MNLTIPRGPSFFDLTPVNPERATLASVVRLILAPLNITNSGFSQSNNLASKRPGGL